MPLLSTHDTLVLVVDMQAKLLPAIAGHEDLLGRAGRLLAAARLLGVPVVATEHWAQKIGATHPALASSIDHIIHKTHFDATRENHFLPEIPKGRRQVLLIGTEAHVCVLQTGLGIARLGLSPILVTDCVGSRRDLDKTTACKRWEHHGLEQVTAEMAMFEWLETPSHPQFPEVLALIKSA